MISKSRFAVYFDWSTGLRVGGPPGYLANLQSGFAQLGQEGAIDFILRDPVAATAARNEARMISTRGPMFSKGAATKPIGKTHSKSDEALDLARFHTRQDHLFVPPSDMARIDPQARAILHVHTTVDAVKAHNSLTRLGKRHEIILALTTHSPEIPAKEWAEKAFSEGASLEAAELLFFNHRETDLLAFHLADCLIFPCKEAVDPYIGTVPDFHRIFSQKDYRFIPTGAQALKVDICRSEMRKQLGISQGDFIVTYIGRHNSIKGYDVLSRVGVEYLSQHDDAWFLVGGRPGPLPTPAHNRWFEIGWTEVPGNIINCSDVFVLPNKQTYFDLMMVEVLSVGKIVVASNTGGNRYFENKSPGIFLYKTEMELFQILQMLHNLGNGERMLLCQRNKQLYEREFRCDLFARNYLKLLNEIEVDRKGRSNQLLRPTEGRGQNALPKVSIIVAVYNVEGYLFRCLTSISEQSFTDLEIIVVNDGSTDCSGDIIDVFVSKDSRFRRIDRQNGGLSAARNTGLDVCTGEYIAFVDGDDLIAAQMIECLLDGISKTGANVAVCGVKIVDDDEKHVADVTSFLFDEAVYPKWNDSRIQATPDVITSIFPSAWNKLYHKSLFDGVRYPVGLYYEDHPVFYRIFCSITEFAYVNKPLYIHRERASGRITQDGSRRFVDVFAVIDNIESIFRQNYDIVTVRRLLVKITIRLSWERSWVVGSQMLSFKLAELTLMRLYRWAIDANERKLIQDLIVESGYVEKLEEVVNRRQGLDSPLKAIWPLEDTISVVDATMYYSKPSFIAVEFNQSAGYILVHPLIDTTTTAAIHGLSHFGPVRLSFTVALEHESANDVEFRVMILPFMAPGDADTLGNMEPAMLFSHSWSTLSPFNEVEVVADLAESTPTMAIYLQTRPVKDGGVDFAWVRFRNFCCIDLAK